MRFEFGTIIFAALAAASVAPRPPAPLPLLIWHGLGDSYDGEGIQKTGELYQDIYPGAFVYPIRLGDDGSADRHASFVGKVDDQINNTCNDLMTHPELSKAPAVNALGFSQGGQFLRALVERCNVPQVQNLVTFGSQHNGIAEFQTCGDGDWLCKSWEGVLRGSTWGSVAQNYLVPAQYFRDPEDIQPYLESSGFLADINNERDNKTAQYKENLSKLRYFVMIKFDKEQVVVPPESSWFADVNRTSGEVTYLKDRKIYKEDWLGLKTLDERNGLVYATTPGKHMQISDKALEKVFKTWFAPEAQSPVEAITDEGQAVMEEIGLFRHQQDQQAVMIQ